MGEGFGVVTWLIFVKFLKCEIMFRKNAKLWNHNSLLLKLPPKKLKVISNQKPPIFAVPLSRKKIDQTKIDWY